MESLDPNPFGDTPQTEELDPNPFGDTPQTEELDPNPFGDTPVDEPVESTPAPDLDMQTPSPIKREPEAVRPSDAAQIDKDSRENKDAALKKRLEEEEIRRQFVWEKLQNNNRIAKEVVAMEKKGASEEDIAKFKARNKYDEGWGNGYIAALGRLGSTETFSSVDLDRAMKEQEEFVRTGKSPKHFSPLQVLETAVGEGVKSWKEWKTFNPMVIKGYDDKWMEKVFDTYKESLIKEDGSINVDAVAKSELSRKDQNELLLMDAERKTGVGRELWREILNSRFGVTEDDGLPRTTLKRMAQVVDSIGMNIPSWVSSRYIGDSPIARAKALAQAAPRTSISLKAVNGKYYTNNDVEVDDILPSDDEATKKQKAWGAIVNTIIGQTEQQAMENWAQLGDVVLALTGVGATKSAGSLVAKGGAKLGTGTAAKTIAKTGRVAERLGSAVQAAMKPVSTVAGKFAPEAMASAVKAEHKGLKLFQALENATSSTIVQTTGSAIGAPEGMEAQQAIGGALLGGGAQVLRLGGMATGKAIGVPLAHWVSPSNPLTILSKEKSVWNAIVRTDSYDKLPKYAKKRFVESMERAGVDAEKYADPAVIRQDYKFIQERARSAVEFHNEMLTGAQSWAKGEIDNAGIQQYFDGLANSEKGRKVLDTLSLDVSGEGLSVQGRYRKKILAELEKASQSHAAERAKSANEADKKIVNILDEGFRAQLNEIPSDVLNADFPIFMDYIRKAADERNKKNMAFFSDAIQNILEATSPTQAYTMFAMDVAKLYAAVLDSPTPIKLREVLNYIGNLPEFMQEFVVNSTKYDKVSRNPIQGHSNMPAIHPAQTAKALLKDPEAIKQVILDTQADVQFLVGTEGRKAQALIDKKESRAGILEHVKQYREVLAKARRETTLDTDYLEVKKAAEDKIANDLIFKLNNDFTDKPHKGNPAITRPAMLKDLRATIDKLKGIDKDMSEQAWEQMETRRFDEEYIKNLPYEVADKVRNIVGAYNEIDRVKASSASIAAKIAELKDKKDLVEAQMRFIGTDDLLGKLTADEKAVHAAVLDMVPKLANILKDDPIFNNLIGAISKGISSTRDEIKVHDNLLGMLRMYTNAKQLERLYTTVEAPMPNITDKEWAIVKREVNHLTDTLYSISSENEMWRGRMSMLADTYKNATDKIPAMSTQIRFMKDALSTIKRQAQLERYGDVLLDLADRLQNKGAITEADKKLLTRFAAGSMVERYRYYADPDWVITMKSEADRIFKCLKEQTPELHRLGLDLLTDTMGKTFSPDSYKAAYVSSWFINPNNQYDKGGHLLYALALSEYFKKNTGTQIDLVLRSIENTEAMKVRLARDHSISITRQVSEYGANKTRARVVADKLATSFNKDLENITIRGKKPYTSLQTNRDFVDLIKRMLIGKDGFSKDTYLVVDGVVTPQGRAVMEWAAKDFDDKALWEALESENQTNAFSPDPKKPSAIPESEIRLVFEKLKSYFPSRNVAIDGRISKVNAEMYEVAFEFAKIYQAYDKEKVNIRNQLNDAANKRTGKFYPALKYFAKRLGNGAHATTFVTSKDVDINTPSMRNNLFGRELGTSEKGQIAKTTTTLNTTELMHPQEAFLFDAYSLFENVLTRESGAYLQNVVRIYRDSGHVNAANALMGYLVGVEAGPASSVAKLLNYVANTDHYLSPVVAPIRVLMNVVYPTGRLLTLVKTVGENAFQSFTLGVTSNPKSVMAEMSAILKVFPLWIQRAVDRSKLAFNEGKQPATGDLLSISRMMSTQPTQYREIISEMLQGLNPEYSSKTAQTAKRINWENTYFGGSMWKKIDKKLGDKLQAGFGFFASTTKEAMESSMAEIRLNQAASMWRGAVADVNKLKAEGASRERMVGEMYRLFHSTYEGALGNNVGAMDTARTVVDAVLSGRETDGFEGFAAEYTHTQLSRFDADNLPPAIKALARWKPGAAQFYNPLTNGIYRAFLAAHAMKGGAGVANKATATMSLVAMVSATAFLYFAAKDIGSPWAQRIAPIPVPSSESDSVTELLLGLLTNPFNSKGNYGAMEARTYTEIAAYAVKIATNEVEARDDGTLDTAKFNAEQQEYWNKLMEIALSSSLLQPVNFFVADAFDVPAAIGFMWLNQSDIQENIDKAKAMVAKQVAAQEAADAISDRGSVADVGTDFLAFLERHTLDFLSGGRISEGAATSDLTPEQKDIMLDSFTSYGKAKASDSMTRAKAKLQKDKDAAATAEQKIAK